MSQRNERASYAPILAAYGALTGALALAVRQRRGDRIPRPRLTDVVTLGLATFKLSRLISKERVLQPVREPFVERTTPGEGSELNCEPAGSGARRAVGELLTCPFCVSVWIATIFAALFSLAPRQIRLVATGLAAVVVADLTQHGYARLRGQEPLRLT